MDPKTAPQEMIGSQPEGPTQPPQAYRGEPGQQNVNGGMVHATPLNMLGPMPAIVDCPFCAKRCQTRVDEHDSSMTIVAGIGLGILCICCACLPCMLHWFQDVDHYCSSCGQRLCHIPQGGIPQPVQPAPVPQNYQMPPQQQYGVQSPPPQQQYQKQPPSQQQQQQHQQPPQYE